MAGENKNTDNSENNMKIAVTIIIVLVGLLAVAVFALQQKKNDSGVASENKPSTNSSGSVENPQQGSVTAQDAGSLGKNEVKLTNDNFKAEVEDYKGVVLVDFYLATCPYCQKVAKDVTAVSDEMAGKVKVGKLESKENRETSSKFEINGVPTFIIFKDGKEVNRVAGEQTKQQLIDLINKSLK